MLIAMKGQEEIFDIAVESLGDWHTSEHVTAVGCNPGYARKFSYVETSSVVLKHIHRDPLVCSESFDLSCCLPKVWLAHRPFLWESGCQFHVNTHLLTPFLCPSCCSCSSFFYDRIRDEAICTTINPRASRKHTQNKASFSFVLCQELCIQRLARLTSQGSAQDAAHAPPGNTCR
jgi:hypothetical protein